MRLRDLIFQLGVDVLLLHPAGFFHQFFMVRLQPGQLFFTVRQVGKDHIEDGNDEDGQGSGGQHASQYGKADGITGDGAGAGSQHQGHHAQDESQGGHNDGAQPEANGFQGGLDQFLSPVDADLGEFDDQDGVLGGEPDQGDEPDLGVDVIGQPGHQGEGQDGPEGADRHGQHDGQGHRPAFVQGCQEQEYKYDGKQKDIYGRRSCLDLFIGQS